MNCSNKKDYFTNLKWSVSNLPNVYIYYTDTHKTICYKRMDLQNWFIDNIQKHTLKSLNDHISEPFFRMPDGNLVQNIKILDSLNVKYVAVPIIKKGYFSKLNSNRTAIHTNGYLLLFEENVKNGLINYILMNFNVKMIKNLLKIHGKNEVLLKILMRKKDDELLEIIQKA